MTLAAIRDQFDGADALSQTWPQPDMTVLGGGRSAAAKMPTALFGKTWEIITDLANGAGSPVDYVAVSVLAVATSLIGGKRRIQPFAEATNWREPCILWWANVGDPSTNKSPGQDAGVVPLHAMDSASLPAFEETIREYETRLERARAECKAWEGQVKEAQKEGHDTPAKPAAASLPDEPQRRRFIITDATPEAMAEILTGNRFGTFFFRDELAGWLDGFERYAPGGRSFWLESFGGRPYVVDRKNSPKPIYVPFNGVSVLGGIQPEKLAEGVLSKVDDGLAARFIWAWPEPVPYHRPRRVADEQRLKRIYDRLERLTLSRDPYTDAEGPVTLLLSAEAGDIFEAWIRDNNAEVAEAASLYKGFCGKLSGKVLRLALAAELLAWADSDADREPQEVSTASLIASIEFFEDYGKPTAKRVYGDASLPPVERNAAALARYIIKERLQVFNPRDHRFKGPSFLKQTEDRDNALRHLVDADWLRPAPTRAGSSAGRAKNDFQVNPSVLKSAA